MPGSHMAPEKQRTAVNLMGAISGDRFGTSRAIDSQPTAEMRAELLAAGVPVPLDDAALDALSRQFNEWLEEHRHKEGKAASTTFYNLFAEVDKDGSGFLTFDELEYTVRQKLKRGPKTIEQSTLKALWATLDADDSNAIQIEEMSGFFRRGAAVREKPAAVQRERTAVNLMGAISGDRFNMNRAIESQPTAEMRVELAAAGVALPDAEALKGLSTSFNAWLEEHRHKEGKAASTTWFNLFAEIDADGSGYITFDELEDIVRHKLKKGPKVIAQSTLKAMWCALDADDSCMIQKEEMAGFFRQGAIKKERVVVQKERTAVNLMGAISGDRFNMSRALDSQPTADMRTELEGAGVALPGDDQLTSLSKRFNEWLEEYRYKEGKAASTTFYNLFAEVDADGSGYITFDELEDVVRHKLKKGPKTISLHELKALWVVLDADDSNMIKPDEIAGFFRRGTIKKEKPAAVQKERTAVNLMGAISGDRFNMNRAIESQPTAEMRVELAKAGVALPDDDQLTGLSIRFNAWLEEKRYKEGKAASTTFYNLFAEVDADGSGEITFDELEDVVRHKLKKGPKVISLHELKALWACLDADDSNAIKTNEMAGFFRRGMIKKERVVVQKEHSAVNLMGAISGDRFNMNRAIESQPTADMRTELASAGVALPDDAALDEHSKQMNAWLEEWRYRQGKPASTTFFNLFSEVDSDGSGQITFDEFEDVVRHKLKKGPRVFAQSTLKALWCALDADDSNMILPNEIAGFFRRGAIKKERKAVKKDRSAVALMGAISGDRFGMGNALESQPTAEMRTELQAAGLPVPFGDAAMDELSRQFNAMLEELRYREGREKPATWFNLFAEVDSDGSGQITFDELEDVVRHRLKKGPRAFPLSMLKALWCTLDVDSSNSVVKAEMAGFFRRGAVAGSGAARSLVKQRPATDTPKGLAAAPRTPAPRKTPAAAVEAAASAVVKIAVSSTAAKAVVSVQAVAAPRKPQAEVDAAAALARVEAARAAAVMRGGDSPTRDTSPTRAQSPKRSHSSLDYAAFAAYDEEMGVWSVRPRTAAAKLQGTLRPSASEPALKESPYLSSNASILHHPLAQNYYLTPEDERACANRLSTPRAHRVREKFTPRGSDAARPLSASTASLRTAGLANSASAQCLYNRRASSPAYGFGAASRDVANKLFVSQQHTLTLMAGMESPGPTRYSLPASVGGKQPDGKKADPPVWRFGKAGRFVYGYGVSEQRPGPEAYRKHPAIGGKQPDSARKNVPEYSMGTATREHMKKVFISQKHTLTVLAGSESPGFVYDLKPVVGTRQVDAAIKSAPAYGIAGRKRAPVAAGGDAPGMKYEPAKGLGVKNPDAAFRTEPAYGFASKARPPVDAGLNSPGPIYTVPSAMARQVSGHKASAPRMSFTRHSRWADWEREVRTNTVPGPGHYG